MTITLNDPIQRKSETREANDKIKACRGNMFGVLSAIGSRVDSFSGSSFFDPNKNDPNKKLMQRIYLKSAYVRCSLWFDKEHVTCLGVQI